VPFVFFLSGIAEVVIVREKRPGCAFPLTTNSKRLKLHAVEPYVKLTLPVGAPYIPRAGALKLHGDYVFTIQRKQVSNNRSATGTKRKVFAHPVFLSKGVRNRISLLTRTDRRVARREPTDSHCGRHVALEQRW